MVSLNSVLTWIFARRRRTTSEEHRQEETNSKMHKIWRFSKVLTSSWENHWKLAEVEKQKVFDQNTLSTKAMFWSFTHDMWLGKNHSWQFWPSITLTEVYLGLLLLVLPHLESKLSPMNSLLVKGERSHAEACGAKYRAKCTLLEITVFWPGQD